MIEKNSFALTGNEGFLNTGEVIKSPVSLVLIKIKTNTGLGENHCNNGKSAIKLF
jgi:hypothetical protein